MNQSVKLIFLQFLSLGLGLFSVFYIAATIPPKLYAIIGVYEIITTIAIVFSSTGIETIALRNILLWKKEKKINKISEVISHSLILRLFFMLILIFPLMIYAYYMSKVKFNNEYLYLFILMSISSVFSALNNSLEIILKSFNKYFLAALIPFSVNILGRLLALILFIYYGFEFYIYVIMLLPIFITLFVVLKIKKWIIFTGNIKRKTLLMNFKTAKHFKFSTYVTYIYDRLDQLLISVFFSTELLGSYTIAKRILSLGVTIVKNIFNPMIQKLVNFKNHFVELERNILKIMKIRNYLLLLIVFGFPLVYYCTTGLIEIMGLDKYKYLNYFIISIYLSFFFYVLMKVKFTIISLLYESIYYLKLTLFLATMSALFFASFIAIDVKIVFIYLSFSYFITWLYSLYIYKKKNIT